MITGRIEKRKREKDELQGQLAIEMGKQITFTAPQIKAFLYSLKRGNINDENNRRGLINIFLRAIYLFDDRFTLILNGGDRQITIDDILLDDIEEYFDGVMSSCAECSPLVADAPPNKVVDFDRKATTFFICQNALISRAFEPSPYKATRPGVFSGTGFSRFRRLQRTAVKV